MEPPHKLEEYEYYKFKSINNKFVIGKSMKCELRK